MMRIPLGLALVLSCTTVAPLAAQQKVDVRRAVTRNVYVRLNGAFSSLKVRGWDKDSLVLTGVLPRDARLEPAMGSVGGAPATGVKFYVEGPPTENASRLARAVRAGRCDGLGEIRERHHRRHRHQRWTRPQHRRWRHRSERQPA